jgi:thiol:disulfide interchange protein DsbG
MKTVFKAKITLLAGLLALTSFSALAEPSSQLKNKMAEFGNVKSVAATESKGVYAWTLEKGGKTLVLFNTPDEKHVFKGTIWRLSDKKVISNTYAVDSLKYASEDFKNRVLKANGLAKKTNNSLDVMSYNSSGHLNLKWNKTTVPASIQMLDSLAGVKEGKGKPVDTLYIIYDPRCPWCHEAFEATRKYVKMGYSIKWIPTAALGASEAGYGLASAVLQNPNMLAKAFEKDRKYIVKPTNKNIEDLDYNLTFLREALKAQTGSEKAQVPAGFFLNKQTGRPQITFGLSEKEVLESLFGAK